MIRLTDTHSHYDDPAFDQDRYQLLDRLFEQSVGKIVTVGCSYDRWRAAMQLADCYNHIYAALGIHPEDVYDLPPNYLHQLEDLCKNPKVKALGEMGLDYHYENYDRELQIKVFREQLLLADHVSMPVIIHSRDATADTLEILREMRPKKAVMHCFSGSAEVAREILDLGLYISFTGVITFKNARRAVEACEAAPLDRLMLETDCPYMAPVPYRGQRCDSSMILSTAEKIGEIKGLTAEEVIKQCNDNADKFFGM